MGERTKGLLGPPERREAEGAVAEIVELITHGRVPSDFDGVSGKWGHQKARCCCKGQQFTLANEIAPYWFADVETHT